MRINYQYLKLEHKETNDQHLILRLILMNMTEWKIMAVKV